MAAPKPLEVIAGALNGTDGVPQVYVDAAPQGTNPPYGVIKRVDPRLERYFGGAFQRIDFQIGLHEMDYSADVADRLWADQQAIEGALELQSITGLTDSLCWRLAPPRTNTDNDSFSIVQTFTVRFRET